MKAVPSSRAGRVSNSKTLARGTTLTGSSAWNDLYTAPAKRRTIVQTANFEVQIAATVTVTLAILFEDGSTRVNIGKAATTATGEQIHFCDGGAIYVVEPGCTLQAKHDNAGTGIHYYVAGEELWLQQT